MEDKFKTIKMIHFAIITGVSLAYVFASEIHSFSDFELPEFNSSNLVYFVLPLLAIFISNFLYRKSLQNLVIEDSIDQKIAVFQKASLIRWAVIEGVAFLLLFLKPDFVVFGVLLIFYLILIRPTNDTIRTTLGI